MFQIIFLKSETKNRFFDGKLIPGSFLTLIFLTLKLLTRIFCIFVKINFLNADFFEFFNTEIF